MNRGRRSEKIFSDAQDHVMLTESLMETSDMWHIRIAAYCLMPNHYHMLVQTPEANISLFFFSVFQTLKIIAT
jgi:REP element-mobilizing transposase RayT